jgi:hypothetical protein
MPALKVACIINTFVLSIYCQTVSRCPREIHHEFSQVDPHGTGKERLLMAGQYSLRSFLRHVPNALLQRYLQSNDLGHEIDWGEVSETQVNPIVHEIGEAPENYRAQIESDFRLIHSMATEGGLQTIIDESREFPGRIDLTESLGLMSGHHERAFWSFLEHRRVFDVAYRFNRADNLPGRSWRKRGNFPEGEPAIDEERQQRLADAISAYYREREGRGYSCTVEHYRRGGRLYSAPSRPGGKALKKRDRFIFFPLLSWESWTGMKC